MASISDVAAFLEKGKITHATESPVLFIGAGASIASGSKNMEDLITAVLQDYNIQSGEIGFQEKLSSFYKLMEGLDDAARWAVLKDYFDKLQPSEGYLFLAKLIKAGYFNIILSTNFDNLLEESLLQIGFKQREDFIVLPVQYVEASVISDFIIRYTYPAIKIIKLHGDLHARKFMFTPDEIFEFPHELILALNILLRRDVLIVGHSGRDTDFIKILPSEGGSIWYISPDPKQEVGSAIKGAMIKRHSGDKIISENEGHFDIFFKNLADRLLNSKHIKAL
jgi:hypothetical protein